MAVTEDINIRLGVDTAELERVYRRIANRTGDALATQANRAIQSFDVTYQEKISELEQKYNTRIRKTLFRGYPPDSRFGFDNEDRETYKKLIDLKDKEKKVEAFLKEQSYENRKRALSNAVLGVTSGVAGAMAVAAPIKASMDFEKSLTNTAKVYNMTKKETDEFGKKLLVLSKTMPVLTDQLGALSYQMAQVGLNQKELIPALTLAVKAGMGLDIPLEEVGQKIGGLKAAFGINMQQLQGALDFINEAANKVSASPAFILSATTRIAPLAASKGITPEQTSALASVLLNAQWQPETVETGIKDFIVGLTSLYKSSGGTSAKSRAVQRLNLNRAQFEYYAQTDFMKAVEYFLTSARSAALKNEKVDAIMYEIFGQQHFGKLLTMLSGSGWEKFKELMDMYDKKTYLGSLEGEYQRVAATASSALIVLQNNFKALQIAIGDSVLPVVKRAFVEFSHLTGVLHDISSSEWGKPFVGLATALGAGLGIMALLIPSMKLLKVAMESVAAVGGKKYGMFSAAVAGGMALKEITDWAHGGEGGNYGSYATVAAGVGGLTALYSRGKGDSTKDALKRGGKTGLFALAAAMIYDWFFDTKTEAEKAKIDKDYSQLKSNPESEKTIVDNSNKNQYNNVYNDNRSFVINNPSVDMLRSFNEVVFDQKPKGWE